MKTLYREPLEAQLRPDGSIAFTVDLRDPFPGALRFDLRARRVRILERRIASGTYRIDGEAVADAMLASVEGRRQLPKAA